MKKLSYKELVLKAIVKLRKPEYKGIHSVYSGLSEAMQKYYGIQKEQVWSILAQLHEDKVIYQSRCKGGTMVYIYGEQPERNTADVTLQKIGL